MSGGVVLGRGGGGCGHKSPSPLPPKDAFLEDTQSQGSANIPEKSMQSLLLEGAVPGPRCDALKSLRPGLALTPEAERKSASLCHAEPAPSWGAGGWEYTSRPGLSLLNHCLPT